jgi:hypothetical protein
MTVMRLIAATKNVARNPAPPPQKNTHHAHPELLTGGSEQAREIV